MTNYEKKVLKRIKRMNRLTLAGAVTYEVDRIKTIMELVNAARDLKIQFEQEKNRFDFENAKEAV